DPRLQGLSRWGEVSGPGRLVGAICGAHVHRDRADRGAIPFHRAKGPVLMVENRPLATALSHAVLILGVIAVAFPLYVTFVASTLTLEEILAVPMPLVPGDQFFENYSQVLAAGSTTGSTAPVSTMLF